MKLSETGEWQGSKALVECGTTECWLHGLRCAPTSWLSRGAMFHMLTPVVTSHNLNVAVIPDNWRSLRSLIVEKSSPSLWKLGGRASLHILDAIMSWRSSGGERWGSSTWCRVAVRTVSRTTLPIWPRAFPVTSVSGIFTVLVFERTVGN